PHTSSASANRPSPSRRPGSTRTSIGASSSPVRSNPEGASRAGRISTTMDRELLLEIGCEELPAAWLVPLTRQLGEKLAAKLAAFRLTPGAPIETFSTPRRLTAGIARISERQTDLEEPI